MSVVPYRVTREHREGLVTKAKVLSNKAKEEVRRIHNNFAKKAKAKEGKLSEDLIFKVTLKVCAKV